MEFQELGLNEQLSQAVTELGFVTPMPIQEKAIPVLLEDRQDVVGLAQTGTGKTGAFGLPLLQRIDESIRRPQALVLCPTRELCIQITRDIKRYSRHMAGVHTVAVYGGAGIVTQMQQIKRGAHIIVATPGRLIDLLHRKVVKMAQVSVAVLDEADEMLNMGFKEEIDKILDTLPAQRRIWLFSATMPSGVAFIAKKYLADPVNITVMGKNRTPKNIAHTCYTLREKDRYEALKRVLDFSPGIFGLVFCRTRKLTQEVAASLMKDGYDADALHGDLSQSQRDYVMGKFRSASVRILVATDVAARGLDVDDITHVIHYNLPDETEVYTHRSGRTARAGKCGASIVLINMKEKYRVQLIEKRCKIKFDFGKIPAGKEICKKQLLSHIEKIVDAKVNDDDFADYLPDVYEALRGIDKEELIKRFVSSEFTRFIENYRHAGDINVKTEKAAGAWTGDKSGAKKGANGGIAKQKPSIRNRMKGKKTQRFFINVGRLDKINPGAIIRLVCDGSGIRSNMIGQIDLKREFSFFEVEQQAAGRVRQFVKNARLDGRAVKVREVVKKNIGGKTMGNHSRQNKRSHHHAAVM
ncbi:MAG: DEAD/DEAH box helicase [Desulfobacteraceae bacterium 4572_123]|nr:MAG: DEAD/DEAH box helicase [Desulfobacteraceae bacterium 4572_123]